MKKFFYSMVAMLMIAATAVLSSCSSEDEESSTFFSLGISEMQISGVTGSEDAPLWEFSAEVESAYRKALGMNDDNTLIIKGESYKSACADMKNKFENTSLPSLPSINGTYKLTYALTAYNSGNQETIATKTFTNK